MKGLFPAIYLFSCLIAGNSFAGSATWNQHPTSGQWDDPANWMPEVVPNGLTDIATFNSSDVTNVTTQLGAIVSEMVFNPSASSYTFGGGFSVGFDTGSGIVNNSGVVQTFDLALGMDFAGTATAGTNTVFIVNASAPNGGAVFSDQSDAGSAVIEMGAQPGKISFLTFDDQSSASNSTITLNSGGYASFRSQSALTNATLIVNSGGVLVLRNDSTGGMARLELSTGANLVLTQRTTLAITIGSLEGSGGSVTLGDTNLSIGSNGLSASFGGVLSDGNASSHGLLTKVGTGTLTLSGSNTYTGGTTVTAGALLVQTGKGSATGTGPVQVNAGTFGGRSNIAGAVTIGSGSGAFLAPGINGPGVLTIRNSLSFQADGVYQCDLSLRQSKADKVSCRSVSIATGAQFMLQPKGNQRLASGTEFTVINNAGRKPINGAFVNLPDGGTITAGPNTLQASYEGGDGNDLTLTVVQ